MHQVLYHGFADDMQLSLKDENKQSQQIQIMENCLADIHKWMVLNKLKLNDSETELVIITSKGSSSISHNISISFGEETIMPKKTVRNLGAVIDSTLSMESQISAVNRNMYFHLRRIAKVKRHLSSSDCAKAVNATVLSRLDYHNGMLLGAPDKVVRKLQVAQNNAARLLTDVSRRDHVTPVLQQIHWLPVRERITFKILTTIQKSLHDPTAPEYLAELCVRHQPGRSLRVIYRSLEICCAKNKKQVWCEII
jgi:hypothetical protein